MRLGTSLGDALVEICIQVSLFKNRVNNVDWSIPILTCSTILVGRLLLHESCVLDALLSQAELQHFDPANEVLIDVLLRLQLAL